MAIGFGLSYGYMMLRPRIVVVHAHAQELYDGEEGGEVHKYQPALHRLPETVLQVMRAAETPNINHVIYSLQRALRQGGDLSV